MYGREEISAAKLLALYSQDELWKAVLPDFSLEKYKKTHCPYRRDESPSFSVFKGKSGDYIFTDFGKGESGNILMLASLMFGTDIHTSVRLIAERVGDPSRLYTKTTLFENKEQPVFQRKKISIKKREFNKEDAEYWLSYHISKETLDLYEVFPVEFVWVNDVIVAYYVPGNPVYAYRFGTHIYKILQPYADKEDKWISNTTKHEIQGWNRLSASGELLVITKALKDVMVFHEIGIPAIAPQTEASLLDEAVVGNLRSRFKDITVWFDNDPAGVRGAEKYSQKYGFRCKVTPETKDPSDYAKQFGLSNLKDLL